MAKSVSERVQEHRNALRRAGLRPIQIWVPDTRRPDFIEEARRQSRSLHNDPTEKEVLDWIDDVTDTEDWQ
ncbi:antitoxin MazE family protein [Phytohalomonas tamaricis]|uniref:antitoxin MazE family protein n=1 Tax=Phytohalomonas tamaricis TaxID=2081032 RepID=UPI000D0BB4FC|nr:antitoxin MazE family protein [Phytohalomonas tamaricis]